MSRQPVVRARIVAVVLAAGAVAVAAVLLWHPFGERNDLSYAALAPVRDAAWAGAVIDGLGFAAVGVALGLAACLLAPARGAVWASTGAVLTGAGGIAFCAGMYAVAVLAWFVTATEVVPPETGTELMAYVEENFGRVGALQMAGFLLFTVGALVLMVALWRARSVPRWFPGGFAVLTLAAFAPLPSRVLDLVQAVQFGSLVLVAWWLWRQPVGRAAGVTPIGQDRPLAPMPQ